MYPNTVPVISPADIHPNMHLKSYIGIFSLSSLFFISESQCFKHSTYGAVSLAHAHCTHALVVRRNKPSMHFFTVYFGAVLSCYRHRCRHSDYCSPGRRSYFPRRHWLTPRRRRRHWRTPRRRRRRGTFYVRSSFLKRGQRTGWASAAGWWGVVPAAPQWRNPWGPCGIWCPQPAQRQLIRLDHRVPTPVPLPLCEGRQV